MFERPGKQEADQTPRHTGSVREVGTSVDCGFHPPRGAPYPLPQLPLPPGGAALVCFPLCHPFYDGEGWFSPNPADTSSFCLSLTLPPREAPRRPPEMSLQDRAPATRSSSQMGLKRGSGSPLVTRHVVSSGLRGLVSSMPHHSPGRRVGEEPAILSPFHMGKLGLQGRPELTQDTPRIGELELKTQLPTAGRLCSEPRGEGKG